MKNIKVLRLRFGFIMLFMIFFIGCNGLTTDIITTSTDAGNTTVVLTTENIVTTSSSSTTNAQLTTTESVLTTTDDVQVITTEYSAESYPGLDELFVSVDRLDNAVFDIDFSEIFAVGNDAATVSDDEEQHPSIISLGANLPYTEKDWEINPDDYTQHPYWRDTYYNNELFSMPTLDNGYYLFDGGLANYSDTALNNLYDCAESQTSQSKEKADWAVENIKVMDTWVTTDYNQYLLHYDSANDVVTLYTYFHYEWPEINDMVDSYRKISIYYNSKGEEVIESWINEVHSGYYPRAVTVYYNSVAARDFNFYDFNYDSEGEFEGLMMRGINKNEDGRYEYYDQTRFMVSGENGWYEILPKFDMENNQILVDDDPTLAVYNSEGNAKAFEIYSTGTDYLTGSNAFHFTLYLPSFSGIEAALAAEDMLKVTNVDSEDTLQFLIGQGITPMSEIYLFDNYSDSPTGFRTSVGDFLSSDEAWDGSVTIKNAWIEIAPEGIREENMYRDYYVKVNFKVTADTLQEAVQEMVDYLDYAGVEYEYGNLEDILSESFQFLNNYNDITRNVTFVNDIFGLKYYPFTSYDNYANMIGFTQDYVYVKDAIIDLMNTKSSISINDMPSDIPLDSVAYLDLSDKVSGSVTITENGIDASGIAVEVNPSILFQEGEEYTIFYGFAQNDKIYMIGKEAGVDFANSSITINGSVFELNATKVPPGEYIICMFFGKVTDEGYVRISNAIPIPIASFEDTTITIDDVEGGSYTTYLYRYYQDAAYVQTTLTDIQSPVVTITGYENPITDQYTIAEALTFGYGTPISDLFSLLESVTDNIDGTIEIFDYTMISCDAASFSSADDPLVEGNYTLSIADSAGNITTINLSVTLIYSVTFIDNYENILSVEFVNYGEAATAPEIGEIITWPGYTWVWDKDFSSVTDNLVVKLIPEVNIYTITYYVDNQVYQSFEVAYDTELTAIEEPVMEGYTFSGWSFIPPVMPDADVEVYGSFTVNP